MRRDQTAVVILATSTISVLLPVWNLTIVNRRSFSHGSFVKRGKGAFRMSGTLAGKLYHYGCLGARHAALIPAMSRPAQAKGSNPRSTVNSITVQCQYCRDATR
jgi:hypothetical protein